MVFDPNNKFVKVCLEALNMEKPGARQHLLQALDEATHDFARFLLCYFLARNQENPGDKIKWLEAALQSALMLNDDSINSAFPVLYSSLAKGYEDLGDAKRAKENYEKAAAANESPSDKGPFYHGTRANLPVGSLLTAGQNSNYKNELKMNHIYFTALENGAGLAAALAKGDNAERVYIVEPTGKYEHDPNVTNKLFPGNLTRSYRSEAPLKIVGEVKDWVRLTPEELQKWRAKLANSKGEIIN